MTQNEQRLKQLQLDATVYTRNKVNSTLQRTGTAVARSSGRLVTSVIIGVFLLHILLFLNIALGFALGTWTESSPAMGFLYLAGIYVVLTLIAFLLKPLIQRWVRNSVARSFIKAEKTANEQLDKSLWLKLDKKLVRRSAPETVMPPYDALIKSYGESSLLAEEALENIEEDLHYFGDNYKEILTEGTTSAIASNIPMGKVLTPVIEWASKKLINSITGGAKHIKEAEPRKPASKWEQYAPYAETALGIVRPLLVGYAMTQAHGLWNRLWRKRR